MGVLQTLAANAPSASWHAVSMDTLGCNILPVNQGWFTCGLHWEGKATHPLPLIESSGLMAWNKLRVDTLSKHA